MGEKIARLLDGAGSILTFGSASLGEKPRYYDAQALSQRGVERDFSAVAQDIAVANCTKESKDTDRGRESEKAN